MKHILKKMLCVILTAAIILSGNVYQMPEVSAAADLAWGLSISVDGHDKVKLSVSGVDAEQTVTAHITAGSDAFTKELEITRKSQDFEVVLDKGYKAGTKVSVYLETADHKKTMTASYEIKPHDLYLSDPAARPKRFTATAYSKEIVNKVSVDVGIGNVYEGRVGEDGLIQVDYPIQNVGDKIQVTWGDGYCQKTEEFKVENSDLYIASLEATRSEISGYTLQNDVRLHARISGVDYYSAYGRDHKSSQPFIKYPVQPVGQNVELWLEAEDGSIKQLETLTIKACKLSWVSTWSWHSYPKQTIAEVPENSSYVIAKIGKNEYRSSVQGRSCTLNYPSQKQGTVISLTAYDTHGCSTEEVKKTVENDNARKKTEEYFSHAGPSRACGYPPFYDRLCAEINGKIYYGNFPKQSSEKVYVSYPPQPVGTKIKFWYETSNGSYTNTITRTVVKKKNEVTIKDLSVNRISGDLYLDQDYYSELASIRATVNGKTYNGTVKYNEAMDRVYNISFPQQKVGSKVTVTLEDKDGYKVYASSTIKNKAIKFKLNAGTGYADGEVWGETLPKTKITLKIGNRTYNTTADNDGDFSIYIPIFRTGTKVYIKAVAPNGYYKVINTSIKKSYCKVKVKNTQFTKTKYANIQCTGAEKTDKLKIKVSGKTITKKIKGKKFNETIKVKLPKKKAGKSIKVIIYDKYGDQRASTTKQIYIGRNITVGMSTKKAVLTTWGKPVYKTKAKKGYKEWGFIRGNYGLIALIKKGKVRKIYKGRLN